jgi:hypothetical protein
MDVLHNPDADAFGGGIRSVLARPTGSDTRQR